MSVSRIPLLALASDLIGVLVFAAIGRLSHDEPGDLLGLLGTAAPFAVGLLLAWVVPLVRATPVGLRAGAVVLAGAAGLGLALRAAITGRLPLTFVVVTVISLAVLLLGWRLLSAAVTRAQARIH